MFDVTPRGTAIALGLEGLIVGRGRLRGYCGQKVPGSSATLCLAVGDRGVVRHSCHPNHLRRVRATLYPRRAAVRISCHPWCSEATLAQCGRRSHRHTGRRPKLADTPPVLAPFEISSKVWIQAGDLDRLAASPSAAARSLVAPSRAWLALWSRLFGVDGFNPFDTLAVAYAVSAQGFACEVLPARIDTLPDDVTELACRALASNANPTYLRLGTWPTHARASPIARRHRLASRPISCPD